jgi:hypothetical protein
MKDIRCKGGELINAYYCFECYLLQKEPGELSWYNNGLRAWAARVKFPEGARDFSLLNSVQTGSGAHLAS